jgi:hypothetical protein
MDVRAFSVLALLFAGPASAQQVHKCIEGGKAVYQSAPCANGGPVKTWVAPPDAPNPDRQARLDAIQRDLDQRRQTSTYAPARRNGTNGAAISQHKDPGRCESAKAQRKAVFDAAGLRRSFETSRRMDDLVYDACK